MYFLEGRGLPKGAVHFIIDNFTCVIQNRTAKTQQKIHVNEKSVTQELSERNWDARVNREKDWEEKYRNAIKQQTVWAPKVLKVEIHLLK